VSFAAERGLLSQICHSFFMDALSANLPRAFSKLVDFFFLIMGNHRNGAIDRMAMVPLAMHHLR